MICILIGPVLLAANKNPLVCQKKNPPFEKEDLGEILGGLE